MAGGEENKKIGEGKGFAGLSSLVSDVDTTPPPVPKKTTSSTGPAPGTSRPSPQPTPPPQPNKPPQQPSSGSSAGKWWIGIAVVVGLLWVIGQANKTTTTSPAPDYSPSTQSAAPSYSPPEQPQAPSRPEESLPPVGQNMVLSTAQIRYCLAEDIRMDGAKTAINNYIESDVDRFNAMVADYNSRCGSFRYRRGALESARRDIEQYRSVLLSEGGERFSIRSTPQSSTNGNNQNQLHQPATEFDPAVQDLNPPTARRQVSQPFTPSQTYRDTSQDEAMARLRRDAEDRRDQREQAEKISSTPGAHKKWDYRVGRDIWVDAYGNPIE